MNEEIRRFLALERADRRRVDFKLIYVDMAGDLAAGLLLSQIVYWHLPDANGNSKIRVHHDGHVWIAKNLSDWWDETRLSAKQARRALKILEDKGLIVRIDSMFAGKRTPFIRINWPVFLREFDRHLGLEEDFGVPENEMTDHDHGARPVMTKGHDRSLPKGTTGHDQRARPITETTTETTTEITTKRSRETSDDVSRGGDHHARPSSPNSQSGKKKKRSPDERLKHPAVQAWSEATGTKPYRLNNFQRGLIVSRIRDDPDTIRAWRAAVEHWLGHGWNPVNVAGQIEFFERGGAESCRACQPAPRGGRNNGQTRTPFLPAEDDPAYVSDEENFRLAVKWGIIDEDGNLLVELG